MVSSECKTAKNKMNIKTRISVRIETVDVETGEVMSAENHPHEFPCPSLDGRVGDKIDITTLGRVVAATAAALAAELQHGGLDSSGVSVC